MHTKTSEEWKQEFIKRQAYWKHDGNPKSPHVELRSGLHSNGFFYGQKVVADNALLQQIAFELIHKFHDENIATFYSTFAFVGPQTGATKLAEALKNEAVKKTGKPAFRFASPAKQGKRENRSMVFAPAEASLVQRKYVTLCEDTISTGGSLLLVQNALLMLEARIQSCVLAIVNRSEKEMVLGKKIIALINEPMPQWKKDECHLCRQGSKVISNPKDHWDELNAKH